MYFLCVYSDLNLHYTKFISNNFKAGDKMKFEIKKQEYVNRTFRISKELAERLSRTAQQENISVNELVVQSCEFALDNLAEQQNEDSTIK